MRGMQIVEIWGGSTRLTPNFFKEKFNMKELLKTIKAIIVFLMILYFGITSFILGLRFCYLFIISQPMDQWSAVYSSICFIISFVCRNIWKDTAFNFYFK